MTLSDTEERDEIPDLRNHKVGQVPTYLHYARKTPQVVKHYPRKY